MKKSLLILGIAASVFTASCSKSITEDKSGVMTGVTLGAAIEQQSSESRSSLDGGTVKWTSGDQLSVLSSESATYGGDKFILRESCANQSNGLFDGDLTSAAQYFALYPYSQTAELGTALSFPVPDTQEYVAGSFANGANASVAVFTNDNLKGLTFKNMFGMLKLSLKAASSSLIVSSVIVSDNAGVQLNGTATVSVSDILAGNPVAKVAGGSSSITLNFSSPVTITSASAVDIYIVVPEGAFAKGFSAQIKCANGFRTVSTTQDNTIKRSFIHVMPEIAIPAEEDAAVDLSASGCANCYVVPTTTAKAYKFNATVKGNEKSSSLNPTSAVLVWETDNTADAIGSSHIVTDVKLDGGFVKFTATGKAGNALVAVTDGTDVLWSWHIWCVSDLTVKGPFPSGKNYIDRELGALSNGTDLVAAGLRYQWGRKDPFMGPANYKSSSSDEFNATYGAGFAFANPGKTCADIATSIKTPTTIYATTTGWLAANDNTLWTEDTKTVYDPCPVGYRVAPRGTWKTATKDTFSYGYNLSYNSKDLGFFPAAGFRNNATGLLKSVSTYIYSWTSYSSGNKAVYLSSSKSTLSENVSTTNHAFACPVRCCEDN